jgi:hypothetical protein
LQPYLCAHFIPVCAAQDAAGCKDSPLIGRFPGSVIAACKNKDDEKFTFTLDKGGRQAVEGEFRSIEPRMYFRACRPRPLATSTPT